MNKRTVSILLLAAMLTSLAACGGEAASAGDTTAASADTTAAPETTAEIISNALPDKDFGGFEFRILTTDEVGSIRWSFEIDAESLNGEVMNDAVFERNQAVEERFNAVITQIPYEKASFKNAFTSSVMAGDDTYDVYVDTVMNVLSLGYLYGLSVEDLPYVDPAKPWWDQTIMQQAAIGGTNYGLSGDINLTDDWATWSLYFNKDLAEELKVGDLYQMVYDGKWTLDALKKVTAGVTSDINGDGILDHYDRWGMMASGNVAGSMLWSAGGMLGTLQKDGSISLSLDSVRNMDALNKIYDLFAVKDSVIITDRDVPSKVDGMSNWDFSYKTFSEGRALFFGACLNSMQYFREMEDEYGYLPNPKFDENQKGYISTAQEWCATMFMVPKTAPDPERSSILLEAMASASAHYTTPAFYDVQLTRKYARDDESEKILDILFENRVLDLVYAFNFGNARSIATTLRADSNTIASTIASLKTAAQSAYETTYKDILAAE